MFPNLSAILFRAGGAVNRERPSARRQIRAR